MVNSLPTLMFIDGINKGKEAT